MNPELKQYLPIAYIAGGVLLFIIFVIWLVSPKYTSLSLQETPFKEGHHPEIIDDRIYSYNGAAFYSVKPSDPKDVTVLTSGMRLPAVEQLYWAGNKGALVVFGDTQTDGSLLEQSLAAIGQSIDENTMTYVWYVDFSAKTISLASTSPMSSDSVFYSKEKQSFYFSTYGPDGSLGQETDVLPPLRSFNTSSKRSELVIKDIGQGIIRYIGACTQGELCIIQDTNNEKQGIWAIKDGEKKLISNTYNQVLPTNSPAFYIGEKNDPTLSNEDAEDLLLQAELFLINLDTNKTTPLGAKVNVGANTFINISDDGKKTTILDDSLLARDNTSVYTQTAPDLFGNSQSRQKPYDLKGGKLSENIVRAVSNTTVGTQLVSDTEGSIYLLGSSSYKVALQAFDEKMLSEAIKPCLSKYTKYHEYTADISQMMVGVVFDANFQKNIDSFSTCVSNTSKQALIGQTYTFVGLSPIDGRFVTN